MASNTAETGGHKIVSRLSYSFGAFGHDMFYATLSTYFMIFITSHLFDKSSSSSNDKMIFYITFIIGALRVVELLIDPFIGNAIDNTNSRWGHFKPWILAGGTIGSVALSILFSNMFGLNDSNPLLYLIIFAVLYIMMDIFYSFKDVGFWSMIPAISFDSEEREKTATFARVGSNIGANIVGVIVMPLVVFFSVDKNHGQGDLRGWFLFAVTVAFISWFSAVIVAMGTKENDSLLRKNTEKTRLRDVFKVLGRNDQLMWLSLTYGLYTAGIQITNASELYYFTYIMGKPGQYSWLMSINMIVGIFAVLLFPPLAQKFSRRNVFFYCIGTMLLAMLIFSVAGSSLILVLIAAVMFYLPQPLVFLVVLMIISDSVEYGQLKFGHRDESLTLAVRPLLDKLGGAISNWVVAPAAVLAGMTAGATASTITNSGHLIFKAFMFGVPALLMIIGTFIFFKKVTLDEKEHAKIVDELEKTWNEHLETNGEESMADIVKEVAKDTTYKAPISGTMIALSDVSDQNFASGNMGKGFAIKPSDGKVFAPFDGTVEATFPTRHAIGLRSDNGILTLIHIGIGTVEMRGTGFVQYVQKGQHVTEGQELIEFWDPAIKKAGYDDTVMVVINNWKDIKDFNYTVESGDVNHGDDLLTLSKPEESSDNSDQK